MKALFTLCLFVCLFSCQKEEQNIQSNDNLVLNYDTAAKIWEATLPLGNGRLGMMPDGGIDKEKIILNDISMWSGSAEDALDKDAVNYLPKIQNLLKEGENQAAQELMYKHFRCKGKGSNFGQGLNAPYGCFQLLGALDIEYSYPNTTKAKNYKRSLNISQSIAYAQFEKSDIQFKREYFVSQTNDIMLIRISANKAKSVAFRLRLSRPEHAKVFSRNGDLCLQGQLNDGHNGNKGVQFFTQLSVLNEGGKKRLHNNQLSVEGADEALILVSSGTDLLLTDYKATVDSLLRVAQKCTFKELKNTHIAAYKEKFDRVTLLLDNEHDSLAMLTMPERLQRFQKQTDPSLIALYFQYGRYLMISGTREGSMPLNLQGLWANTLQTPWNGDYHLNINVQMNYWIAEVCNLSELHKPLIDFTNSLVPSGEKTAKAFYGAKGWVAHVISNPWHFTAPGEHASWGATNTGGAWLCAHLWEHYAFTQDTVYLATAFPTMKKAAQFFLSTMIKEPKNGWLVTAPSSSPENAFYLPNSNKPTYVCMGPTMDAQIIRELFQNTLKAAEILGKKDSILSKIKKSLPLLPPTQISKNGYIQEWLEDYKEVDVHHRHISHLYGLYPAAQINPSQTPDLAEAARITLNRRGDEATGWSRAWKVNFWARLYDGNRAYKLLKKLLKPTFTATHEYLKSSGTYPNLFCAHPPFQIDGNFGGTAGIAEMLIQSHEGYVHLLPALPAHWENGSFSGLKVRGGATVSAVWKKGRLKNATITATATNTFRIKIPDYVRSFSVNNKEISTDTKLFVCKLQEGETLSIYFKY